MLINTMKAVVFGGRTGLLGQSLVKALQEAGAEVIAPSRDEVDVLDQESVRRIIEEFKPDAVFNAVAYTQVDLAEDKEEDAFALNATVPPLLAAQASRVGALFVHYSTDFIFRGNANIPYQEHEKPGAVSIYGISKAGGEQGLMDLDYERTLIIRISWLFGPGKMNFVQRILELAAERDRLTVVADQTGSPSYTPDLAANTLELIKKDALGVYHLCNTGVATWHDLASAAVAMAGIECNVEPISSSEWPTKATRPAYSVLDTTKFTGKTGVTPRHWRDALREYVEQLTPVT
ncbi:dTDP-4-dehydrorhamnose reductase [Salidesulfovibrio brasiliensis]|uniref:dTDP-4-dehydrorhamnose reductase n=1 Tax=Salidesulfovibrio brasiliensis TaxID=221711 RepID=UPI000ABBD6A3|nr:dTDP-4-dehydrorhamnose reductase [Salidesulfovibrio brasiliensis]